MSDNLISLGGSVKMLEQNGDLVTVGAHGILWGDAARKDLVGDWFTPETNYGASKGMGVDTMLHHGMPLAKGLEEYASQLLPATVKAEDDEHGKLVATVFDMRDAYQRKLAELCMEGRSRGRRAPTRAA